MILAGDIGGTKVTLGLFECRGESVRTIREQTFPSRTHDSLESILQAFFARRGSATGLEGACFGIAGPVEDGRVVTTNLPWIVETSALERQLGTRVLLINDLAAAAYGLLVLPQTAFLGLRHGQPGRGNVAVIAPGTGLGEAVLYFDGTRYHAVASEGGHADFAPRSEIEIDLLRALQRRFGHVSYERVLSGDGLSSIYAFFRDSNRTGEPAWLSRELATGDRNARIAQCGLTGRDEICVRTLDLFAEVLAAEAGNMALRYGAVEVVIGGGIAPKILPALQTPVFLGTFAAKGRFADRLRDVSVRVALEPRAPLLGAAHYAHVAMEAAR